MFGADSKIQQGALRGRLKHLQRLGLPGVEAGKGARITYSVTQANQWLVALLMSDAGIAPNVAVEAIQKHWETFLAMWVRKATDAEALEGKDDLPPNPIFLKLHPRLMSENWAKQKPTLNTLPFFGAFRRFDYHIKDAKGLPIQRELISGELNELKDGWMCVAT